MDPVATVSDDLILSVCGAVTPNISRSALQQLLIDSRLVAKNTSREDLRKKAPNSVTWLKFVGDQLAQNDSRSAALRALAGAVSCFLSDPKTDHRIETAVRKARQAADRGDLERLNREIKKLEDLGSELQQTELRSPGILVYIAAGSDRARDSVAEVIGEAGRAVIVGEVSVTPEKSSTTPGASGIQSATAVADTKKPIEVSPKNTAREKFQTPNGETDDRIRSLTEKLRELANTPPPLQWNLRELASKRVPEGQVEWPTVEEIRSGISELTRKLRETADRLSAASVSISTLPEISQIVTDFTAANSAQLGLLNSELDRSTRAISAKFDEHLDQISRGDLQQDAADVRAALTTRTNTYPVEELESLLVRNRQVIELKLDALVSTAEQIGRLAAYLPRESQDACELKSRHLVLHFKQEELTRLLKEVEMQSEEPRKHAESVRSAADEVGQYLLKRSDQTITDEQFQLVLSAVAEGRGDSAVRALEPPAAKPAPQLRPSIQSFGAAAGAAVVPAMAQTSRVALRTKIADFTPRDRLLAKDPALPSESDELANLLLTRCFAEMERGSVATAVDHALDILQLSTSASEGRDYWSTVGLTILAALPSSATGDGTWGTKLVRALTDSLNGIDGQTLVNYIAVLLIQPRFDEAIAERFCCQEVGPFSEMLSSGLYSAVVSDKPYLLEDVAYAVGSGAAFGDVITARKLLIGLAVAAGENVDVVNVCERALTGKPADLRVSKQHIPEWLSEAISAFLKAANERDQPLVRGTAKASVLRAQVPRSVSLSGGFVMRPGADSVEFALLLSNQQNRSLAGIEVSILRSRNRWLAEDIVCSAGALGPNERRLVQMYAHLGSESTLSSSVDLGIAIRFREPGIREPRYEDVRTELKFLGTPSLKIEPYEGAGGKPLILEGDVLKYSSNTVKKALAEVSAGLLDKGMAALIIGRRRRGKTSILQTIARHADIRARYTIISDSWEDLPSRSATTTFQRLGNIFDRAARSLNISIDPLERRIELNVGSPWSTVQQWLDEFTKQMPVQSSLLLLIDEFQKWISLLDPESRARVLHVLRGLFNRPEEGRLSISIVLSGLTNIRDFIAGSADFRNAFQIFNIEAFTLLEADALIRSNPTIEFDTRAVTQMRHLAGGNPFLINLVGNDIAARLRQYGRTYCLPEDVERVVQEQLDDKENSRVWSFLQYLLKEGEEDHASQIPELPALLGLAYLFRLRGRARQFVSIEEIASEMGLAGIECERNTLQAQLESAVRNELLQQKGNRFTFANGWLAEWLAVSENLLPVCPTPDQEQVLGRFKLIKFLDRGGQASVYEAQDTRSFDRPVVAKIYPRTQPGGVSASVMREARLLHSIEHTAVVRCIEFGSDPAKGDVIVLERAKGDTLRRLLSERPKRAADLIGCDGNLKVQVKFIEQLASALSECHRVGVVHKDLKPENIMVTQELAGLWLPKIIDFGLATNIAEVGSDVRTVGSYTPGYVAPERYRGEGRKAPSDIYSLGVITYELLTGIAPFPHDSMLAREAQEAGTFVSAKERRSDIPSRLSELIAEMMSPDSAARPNAFTLVGRLGSALSASDWVADFESGKRAYSDADAESAFEYFERAAFSAPDEGRRSTEYIQVLDYLIDTAETTGRLSRICREAMQPLVAAAVAGDSAVAPLEAAVTKLLNERAVDPSSRDAIRAAIDTLIQLTSDMQPCASIVRVVELLLKNSDHPDVWSRREDMFLLGLAYFDVSLITLPLVGTWCLTACRKLRERDATLLQGQIWLRRAERLGLLNSAEYRKEAEALEKLIKRTATPKIIPKVPASQDPVDKVIGDDERAHLNSSRVETWVRRLLRLHPYIQGVRRVRRDPKIPLTPTRLLALDHVAQHLTPAMAGIDGARIIPAVLDESYCLPKGTTALRINLILPGGTTLAQREAVIESLRADDSLFGDSA